MKQIFQLLCRHKVVFPRVFLQLETSHNFFSSEKTDENLFFFEVHAPTRTKTGMHPSRSYHLRWQAIIPKEPLPMILIVLLEIDAAGAVAARRETRDPAPRPMLARPRGSVGPRTQMAYLPSF